MNLLFKLSYLSSNFELTLGYLNPALNNSAQQSKEGRKDNTQRCEKTQVPKLRLFSFVCFWVVTRHQYGISALVSQASLGTLRSNDADGNDNVKKTIGFICKTTTFHVHHAFLYISLPVFARLRRKHA